MLPEPPTKAGMFFGSDGLRAGWSALLFVAIVVGLAALLNVFVRVVPHHHPNPKAAFSPVAAMILEALSCLVVFVATWIMARIERRSIVVYGYQGRAQTRAVSLRMRVGLRSTLGPGCGAVANT